MSRNRQRRIPIFVDQVKKIFLHTASTYLGNRDEKFPIWTLQPAGTKCRSQVTENAIKKLDTLLGLSCLIICFISGYATIWHMFGIDHASRCSKSKRTKYRKLHIVLELEEFSLSFGFLETLKQGFIFAPREETWIEFLRGESFANYRLYCNASCRFRCVGTYVVGL